MVAFILIVRWQCPNCEKITDTRFTNQHPFCVHRSHVEWEDGKPVVVVDEGFPMLRRSERWA